MSMPIFDVAESDFQRFAVNCGSPAKLLWTTPDELVFWRRRYWVLAGNEDGRRDRARKTFECGVARNVSIMIEGKCKTDLLTICRVYVAEDQTDAEYRVMPKTGVKMSVAPRQVSTVLVKSKILFLALKWWRRKTEEHSDWD
jgi:hypothetical protein